MFSSKSKSKVEAMLRSSVSIGVFKGSFQAAMDKQNKNSNLHVDIAIDILNKGPPPGECASTTVSHLLDLSLLFLVDVHCAYVCVSNGCWQVRSILFDAQLELFQSCMVVLQSL